MCKRPGQCVGHCRYLINVCNYYLFSFLVAILKKIPLYTQYVSIGPPWWLRVKSPPAVQEVQIQSLSREDPLEKGMATHSSILAWRISQTEEPSGLQSVQSLSVRHD